MGRKDRCSVKILGGGELKVALTVTADGFSKSAIAAIEKAGRHGGFGSAARRRRRRRISRRSKPTRSLRKRRRPPRRSRKASRPKARPRRRARQNRPKARRLKRRRPRLRRPNLLKPKSAEGGSSAQMKPAEGKAPADKRTACPRRLKPGDAKPAGKRAGRDKPVEGKAPKAIPWTPGRSPKRRRRAR